MDRSLYTDSFERLLKEKSDEFRMYPCRRVWHSIYNNIYPGRRWPSIVISIVLLTTFPLIGYLNTKSITASAKINKDINAVTVTTKTITSSNGKIIPVLRNTNKSNIANADFYANVISTKPSVAIFNTNEWFFKKAPAQFAVIHDVTIQSAKQPAADTHDNLSTIISTQNTFADANNLSLDNKILLENYTMQNDQLSQKWTNKLAVQVYASPSVVYGVAAGSPINILSGQGQDNNQTMSLGLEAGTAMQYSLSNLIKVKAGLQFNYASYDVAAYQNNTPVILNDAVSAIASGATEYPNSNGTAPLTLHNETYQFSLPVGLELKLLKSNNFQWSAGATIQPTFIAGGNAYLLSSDNHNYIDESSLINRWNLNAGFETFITYKIDGITWQLGPQFRYQFLSTYGKAYSTVDEKVAIFGVKIGVTKLLH